MSFAEPWEAQVFALAVALNERGVFTWREWTEATAGGGYERWLAELERIAGELVDLAAHREAWARAAARTPHGMPIELTAQDFTPES